MVNKPSYEEMEQRVKELEKESIRRKKAEEALRESEERYRDLYEIAPNAYFSISAEDGSILRCNTAALNLVGYDRDALMGMKVFDLYADTPHGISKAQRVFKRFKKGESIRAVELQMKHKDGYPIWVSLSVEPVLDRNGNVTESRSMVIDITDHKRAENALLDREATLKQAQRLAHMGSWEWNLVNNSFQMSDEMCRIYGIADQNRFDHIQSLINAVIHPDDQEMIRKAIEAVTARFAGEPLTYRIVRPDGEIRWIVATQPELRRTGKDGKPEVMMGAVQDITERKRGEEVLRKKTRELGERVKELNCLYGISNLVEKQDISLEEMLQGTIDLIPPSWRYPEITCARVIIEGREWRTKNFQETIWKQTSDIKVHGELSGVLEVHYLDEKPEKDEGIFLKEEGMLLKAIAERLGRIIERKRAEEALRESEEKYHSMFENIQDVYYEVTLDGIIFEVSPSIEEVSRYKREEVIGKSLYDIYADPKKRDEFVKEILRDGKVTDYEILLKDKDGSQHYCSITAKLVSDKHGNPEKIIGSMHNITERKRMEEALKESEERYRTLVESTSDAVLMLDVERKLVSCNQAFLDLFGYGREEVEGKSIRIIHRSDESFHTMGKCIYPVIKKVGTCRMEWEFVRKDATIFPVETVTSAIKSPEGSVTGYVAIIRDITDRKKAEDALRESEAQKRAILDASIDRLRYVDKDMRVIWANKTTAVEHDMSPEDLVGQTCYKLFIGRDTPCEGCPTVRARETGKIEWAVMHQPKVKGVEGESYWDNYSVPLKNEAGDIVSFIQVARNITDQKRADEHIHTLTQQLMKAQESERQMISRELHDRVGQDLSTLKIGLDTLIDNQSGVLPETRQRISELSNILRDSVMAIRDLSYDLRPPSLDQLGMIRTIFQYCEDFSEKTGLRVDFTSAGMDDLRLDFDTEINLYRLIQEGLNNIRKHAEANLATIRLVVSSPNIILRIEDDGKGFDVKNRLVTAQNEKRMGLRSMEERARLLEGKMRVQSRLGKGARISIEVPYNKEKSEAKKDHINR